MKKGKFAQHVFTTSGKLKQQMNLKISLHAQRHMGEKTTRDFFLEHLHSHNLHEIEKKNTRKPKRLPIILLTYALLTILVSYK